MGRLPVASIVNAPSNTEAGVAVSYKMGMQTSSPAATARRWIEIRDYAGRLLFKYDPFKNIIEVRRGSMVFDLIELDRLRAKAGIPVEMPDDKPMDTVTLRTLDTKAD